MRRVVLLALLCCPTAYAQQPENAAKAPAAYEVAVIKPNTSGSGNVSIHNQSDRYEATNVTLRELIMTCYTLQTPAQLIGLPGWAVDAHYDFNARIDAETAARLKEMKFEPRYEVRKEMMRTLLADRFALVVHSEQRELPIYELVQTKGGSKMKAADPTAPGQGNVNISNTKMTGSAVNMDRLGYFISGWVQRKVVDKTGLPGVYDVTLEWSRDDADNTEKGPSLFTALQEQLGLKLESTKGPVDTIVIDRLQKPTEN